MDGLARCQDRSPDCCRQMTVIGGSTVYILLTSNSSTPTPTPFIPADGLFLRVFLSFHHLIKHMIFFKLTQFAIYHAIFQISIK